MSDREWQAVITPDQLEALKSDPRLPPLIALGRLTNALAIAHPLVMRDVRWQSPRMRRERMSGMLYVAALLHEGLGTAQALGAHFRDLPQYKTGFAALQGDREVLALRQRYLKPLRDKAVFHAEVPFAAGALAALPDGGEVVVASGRGQRAGAIYFDISDHLVLHHLIGEQLSDEAYMEELSSFLISTGRLYGRFMKAAHRLIPVALASLGVRRRFLPRRKSATAAADAPAP